MKASMKLIQQLRSQLPPEAAESLDELETMAGDDAEEGETDSDDELAGDPIDDMPPEDEDDLDVAPSVPMAKGKGKKPSFFS